MKLIVLFALVAVALAEFTEDEKKCASKTGLDLKVAEDILLRMILPEKSKPLTSFLLCLYEHYGILVGHHEIDFNKLKVTLKGEFEEELVNNLVDHCQANTKLVHDCEENAYLITKCISDQAKN